MSAQDKTDCESIEDFTTYFKKYTFNDNVSVAARYLRHKAPSDNVVDTFFTDISMEAFSNTPGKEKSALLAELITSFDSPSLSEVKKLAAAYFGKDLWEPSHVGFIADLYSAKGLTIILNNKNIFTFTD